MAFIIWARNIRVGADPTGKVPTLYNFAGKYVVPVNNFFNELASDNKDLRNVSRGLLFYWSFLEENGLAWDDFLLQENIHLNPLYNLPHEIGRAIDNGEINHSTAMTFLLSVIDFYEYTSKKMILGR